VQPETWLIPSRPSVGRKAYWPSTHHPAYVGRSDLHGARQHLCHLLVLGDHAASLTRHRHQPATLEQIRRVLAIPFKRTNSRLVPYLVQNEVQALLDAPNPTTRGGIRDSAMLHLAVSASLRYLPRGSLLHLFQQGLLPGAVNVHDRGPPSGVVNHL
jgi:hypothetical protein